MPLQITSVGAATSALPSKGAEDNRVVRPRALRLLPRCHRSRLALGAVSFFTGWGDQP